MRFSKTMAAVVGLALNAQSSMAAESKISCTEVAATEAKCKDYDAASEKCDAEVQALVKGKIQEAKTAADECKKKNGMTYVLKCKKELAASTKAVNTPKQLAGSPFQKELVAKPESACFKADAIGAANVVCKGPKSVIEAMQRNCIK